VAEKVRYDVARSDIQAILRRERKKRERKREREREKTERKGSFGCPRYTDFIRNRLLNHLRPVCLRFCRVSVP